MVTDTDWINPNISFIDWTSSISKTISNFCSDKRSKYKSVNFPLLSYNNNISI